MHSDDRIVHQTDDDTTVVRDTHVVRDTPVVRDVEAEAEAELTDAEKIKADGIDEQNVDPR
ncbi:hypothetical protein [Cellulomonas sp. Leaf395]|uniref:hypothetical protein n=1 Tax=Cellulomonas sp. Leaf395 TaxID=1736362 RepID=UPI0006FE8764|nr:hypothetical protein [Cellulomonas sp. Leaf395]KQS97530.1 hypothetical protein ASG23_18605 [Cellulomonas sp. Leaf395]